MCHITIHFGKIYTKCNNFLQVKQIFLFLNIIYCDRYGRIIEWDNTWTKTTNETSYYTINHNKSKYTSYFPFPNIFQSNLLSVPTQLLTILVTFLLVNILCTLHVLLNIEPKAKEKPTESNHVLAWKSKFGTKGERTQIKTRGGFHKEVGLVLSQVS